MRVLLTGGTGRLGTELRALLPTLVDAQGRSLTVLAPGRDELDVTDAAGFERAARAGAVDVILHAAAYTDVGAAERERTVCWAVNVLGTRNAAAAATAASAKLVHISTDYVFWGDAGGYTEADTPGPVRNYYALTKLVAEEAARGAQAHLVIRTSFRARTWPYPEAFADVYTSQDYVDVIAPEVGLAVARALDIEQPTLHIGTGRKSVLELARRRAPEVREGTRASAPVALPEDVSLDASLWRSLKAGWGVGDA